MNQSCYVVKDAGDGAFLGIVYASSAQDAAKKVIDHESKHGNVWVLDQHFTLEESFEYE